MFHDLYRRADRERDFSGSDYLDKDKLKWSSFKCVMAFRDWTLQSSNLTGQKAQHPARMKGSR